MNNSAYKNKVINEDSEENDTANVTQQNPNGNANGAVQSTLIKLKANLSKN